MRELFPRHAPDRHDNLVRLQVIHPLNAGVATHPHPGVPQAPLQRPHDLHRVLTGREDTLVFLHHQPHALRLEPANRVLVAEHPQGAAHQLLPARIHLAEALHAAEGIGEIAAASARHGHLGQELRAGFIDRYVSIGQAALEADGAEAPGRPAADDGDFHFSKEASLPGHSSTSTL